MNIVQKLVIILFSTAFLCSSSLGRASYFDSRSIIGGHPAERYPFYAFIEAYEEETDELSACGGTIVAENAVVTSADCLWNYYSRKYFTTNQIIVSIGDFTNSQWVDSTTDYKVAKFNIHEDFVPESYEFFNDISVLIIEGKFDLSYNSILKPCPVDQNYANAVSIGLGAIQQNPDMFPDVLQEALLDEDSGCGAWEPDTINPEIQVCYSVPGKAAICHEDTGSPLVYKEGNVVQCLVGIASFWDIEKCDNPQVPGAFTKAGYYADWIESHLH